jgi:peptidoglycan/LPS O-acetylase OafA/YrhL
MAQPAAVAFPEPVKEAAVAEPSTVSSTSLPSAKRERVDTSPLEGVRALACAIIAANHWLLWYGEKRHGAIELQGGFAVTVFFFITGFVMYLAYGDKACREDFKYWVRTRVVSETLLDARRVLPERDASASDERL